MPILSITALLSAAAVHAQERMDMPVHFATASAELDAKARSVLDALCARIGDKAPMRITLTGHTDDRGSDAYNLDLSRRRTAAVQQALVRTCPQLAEATVDWVGEDRPVASNEGDAGRALNRRVDVGVEFEEPAYTGEADTHGWRLEPLMPQVDKPREHYRVDAERPIDITTQEGWRVHLDAGSIVGPGGEPVRGPVDISCRGFFDVGEILASGIPMHVGHGELAEHMESVGMFEVLASKNGQPLRLAPGRRITIERSMAAAPSADFNNYMLDPATGAWQEEGAYRNLDAIATTSTITDVERLVAPVEAIPDSLAAWWTYQQERRGAGSIPDTLDFRARLSKPGYCLTTACMPLRDGESKWKGQVYNLDRSDLVPVIRLRAMGRKLVDREQVGFQVQLAKSWLHPEWSAFGDQKVWVYNGPLQRKAFIDSLVHRHLYQDIELVARPGEDSGMLRLKSAGVWHELPVDLSTYRNTKADEVVWERQLSTYAKRLTSKERQFNNQLRAQIDQSRRRIERKEATAYALARRRMRADELAMAKPDWIATCRERYARFQERQAAAMRAMDPMWDERQRAQEVTNTFQMSGFGIYNCDRILERQAVDPAAVAVVDQDGRPFEWHTAYGVLENRTAVITYWGNGTGKGDRLRMERSMASMLFVGRNNEMLVVQRPAREIGRNASVQLRGERRATPQNEAELELLVNR